MAHAVNNYNKHEKKQKREMKALKKKNTMLLRTAKKFVSGYDIKNIKEKDPKKRSHSRRDISSSDSDYDYSLSSDSE